MATPFQSTLPHAGAWTRSGCRKPNAISSPFQSTLPHNGERRIDHHLEGTWCAKYEVSNPRSRMRERGLKPARASGSRSFGSRDQVHAPACGERGLTLRKSKLMDSRFSEFQSTLPHAGAWIETDYAQWTPGFPGVSSPRSRMRERRSDDFESSQIHVGAISIRRSRMGSDKSAKESEMAAKRLKPRPTGIPPWRGSSALIMQTIVRIETSSFGPRSRMGSDFRRRSPCGSVD